MSASQAQACDPYCRYVLSDLAQLIVQARAYVVQQRCLSADTGSAVAQQGDLVLPQDACTHEV